MRRSGRRQTSRAALWVVAAAGLTAVGLPGVPRAEALVPASIEARLIAGDSNDSFGPATDLDGDTAVAAFNRNENGAVVQRSVLVFRRTGTAWALEATLALPLAQTLVTDLAVDGNTVAAGTSFGPTFVFTRSGTTWTQQAALSASDSGASTRFGDSVALQGNTIVVGAPPAAAATGAAYVFRRTGATWAQTAKLTVPGVSSAGHNVAFDAGTVVMGSERPDAVHVFVLGFAGWALQASIRPPPTTGDTAFGTSGIAISGNTLIAGDEAFAVPPPPTFGGHTGTAYVFTRTGTTWAQQAQLLAPDGKAVDSFGDAIALDGDLAFIGAPQPFASPGGKLYAFKRSGTTWGADVVPSPPNFQGRSLGERVALSGTTAMAVTDDFAFNTQEAAFVYRLGDPNATAPGRPTGVTASAGSTVADVAWQAPASDGGALITGYLVTASPGGASAHVPYAARSAHVTGLTNGVPVTFRVVASNGTGNSLPSAPSNPVEPRPQVIVDDVSQLEGNAGTAPVAVPVRLSDPTTDTVTVTLASVDGSAKAGSDYQAATRTVTFPPGSVTAPPATWAVVGETAQEADETFRLDLSASNAVLARPTATVTILDDDVPPEAVNRTVQLDLDPAGGPPDASLPGFGQVDLDSSGRIAAFASRSSNLAPGDTNGVSDTFVRSLDGETTKLASATPTGTAGNGASFSGVLSADGNLVVFETSASDLVNGPDANATSDVVARNLTTGTTELVSVTPSGAAGNGFSRLPVITPDGRYVAFLSDASDLVPGDTNGTTDVFVRDLLSDTTRRASLGAGNVQPENFSVPLGLSSDGRYVLFHSAADNLGGRVFDLYLRDLVAGTTRSLSAALPADQHFELFGNAAASSGTGRFVAFESTDQIDDEEPPTSQGAWLFDRATGTTRALTPTGDGIWRREFSDFIAMSRNGSRVLFSSDGRDYLYDRLAGTTRALPAGLDALAIAPGGGVAIMKKSGQPFLTPLTDHVFIDLDTFTTAPLAAPRSTMTVLPKDFSLSDDGTHAGFDEYLTSFTDDSHPWVSSTAALSANDATGHEGDGTIPVTVRLARTSATGVNVRYATANGSAGPADYTAVTGILRFPRGVTELTVQVPVRADGIAEGAETFALVLSSPVRAILADDRAIVTISP